MIGAWRVRILYGGVRIPEWEVHIPEMGVR